VEQYDRISIQYYLLLPKREFGEELSVWRGGERQIALSVFKRLSAQHRVG